jgi:hypothetical protein
MIRDYSKEAFDIIIQAGQSNAEGYGYGFVQNPYEPNDRVLYFNSNGVIAPAAERIVHNTISGDFSLSFALKYFNNNLLPERNILIIRAAVGGTGFSNNQWEMTGALYLKMIEMITDALALNSNNKLCCFLWHQGENECGNKDYKTHYSNLSRLVISVREKFGCPNFPFIAGDFVPMWLEKETIYKNAQPIRQAIEAVCKEIGNGAFVKTDGLLANAQSIDFCGDDIHFCRSSLYELGERYYEAFVHLNR